MNPVMKSSAFVLVFSIGSDGLVKGTPILVVTTLDHYDSRLTSSVAIKTRSPMSDIAGFLLVDLPIDQLSWLLPLQISLKHTPSLVVVLSVSQLSKLVKRPLRS